MKDQKIRLFDVVETKDGRVGTVVEVYPNWVTLEELPHVHDFPIFDAGNDEIKKIISRAE